MVQNHILGSGKWFGTDLDHTGCIRSHFDDKKFFDFFFQLFSCIFKAFWPIFEGSRPKNSQKIDFFEKSKLDNYAKSNRPKVRFGHHLCFPCLVCSKLEN